MKQIIIIVSILLLMNHTVFAQYERIERYGDGNKRLEVIGSGNDSLATGFYDNGVKQSEGRYMYGKFIGAWHYWHPSGKQQLVMYFDSLSVDSYKNDKQYKGKLIKSVSYYESGEVEKIDNYNEGKQLFTSEYYKNGHIQQLVTYQKEVPATGISWFENGSVQEMSVYYKSYKTEKVNGKEVTHSTSQTLTYKQWHENGQIAMDGQVDATGKKVGAWRFYDTMGNTMKTEEY